MKEASFDSEKFLEIARVARALRPDFSMIAGVESCCPPCRWAARDRIPPRARSAQSVHAALRSLRCRRLPRARALQYKLAQLWDLFRDQYPSFAQGRMVIMGRPVGPTRQPLPTATRERQDISARSWRNSAYSSPKPHGW